MRSAKFLREVLIVVVPSTSSGGGKSDHWNIIRGLSSVEVSPCQILTILWD